MNQQWIAALALAFFASLAQAQLSDQAALELVKGMEGEQRAAWDIVSALVESGFSVEQATTMAVANLRDSSERSYATLAGMCIAPDREERAYDVGNAAVGKVIDADEIERVRGMVLGFAPEQCAVFNPRRQPAGLSFDGGPGIVTPGFGGGIPPISQSN